MPFLSISNVKWTSCFEFGSNNEVVGKQTKSKRQSTKSNYTCLRTTPDLRLHPFREPIVFALKILKV